MQCAFPIVVYLILKTSKQHIDTHKRLREFTELGKVANAKLQKFAIMGCATTEDGLRKKSMCHNGGVIKTYAFDVFHISIRNDICIRYDIAIVHSDIKTSKTTKHHNTSIHAGFGRLGPFGLEVDRIERCGIREGLH